MHENIEIWPSLQTRSVFENQSKSGRDCNEMNKCSTVNLSIGVTNVANNIHNIVVRVHASFICKARFTAATKGIPLMHHCGRCMRQQASENVVDVKIDCPVRQYSVARRGETMTVRHQILIQVLYCHLCLPFKRSMIAPSTSEEEFMRRP